MISTGRRQRGDREGVVFRVADGNGDVTVGGGVDEESNNVKLTRVELERSAENLQLLLLQCYTR